MKNTNRFALTLIGLTVLLIAVIDVLGDKPIDWRKTYNQRDKIPFGLYITHEKLSEFLGIDSVQDFTSTNYEDLNSLLEGKDSVALMYIQDNPYEGVEAIHKLYEFVQSGGEVFISANSLPQILMDTLGVTQSYYYSTDFSEILEDERIFKLADGSQAAYKDLTYPGLFYDLDSSTVSILGYFEADQKRFPNFIKVQVGQGNFFLHLEPVMFSNYFMLKKDSFNYGVAALNFIRSEKVYWFDDHFKVNERSRSPLRVMLENAGLRQAWYLVLVALILFLIFKSKREQRAVEVIMPEPNLSKDFARTISTLYYENGNPGNLIAMKIEYFLYDLRRQFQVDILHIDDAEFPRQLSLKAGIGNQEAQKLVTLIMKYRHASASTDRELLIVNNEIEEFKRKANMQ